MRNITKKAARRLFRLKKGEPVTRWWYPIFAYQCRKCGTVEVCCTSFKQNDELQTFVVFEPPSPCGRGGGRHCKMQRLY